MKIGCFLLFFIINLTYAQTVKEAVIADIDRFNAFIDSKPDSAFYYIKRANRQSRINNLDSLFAFSQFKLGYYFYEYKFETNLAKNYFYNAISNSKKNKYNKVIVLSYNELGLIDADENKYDKALNWYLLGLDKAEKNNLFELKSSLLLNLGNLYLLQKDTINTIKYYHLNQKNAKEHRLTFDLIKAYSTLGIIYSKQKNKKGEFYYKKSLDLAKKNKDEIMQFNIHLYLSYLYLNNKTCLNTNNSLLHIQKADVIQQKLKNKTLLFTLYFCYAEYYTAIKKYDLALDFCYKSLEYSDKGIDSDQIINMYRTIADLYILKKDFQNAYINSEKFAKLKDSIFSIEKNKSFSEIQTKYEVDKKNFKINLLTKDKEIEANKRNIFLLIASVILIVLLVFVLFLRNRLKLQRLLKDKEEKIALQKIEKLENEQQLIQANAIIEGQNTERNRLAKDIHDGIGATLAGIKLEIAQLNSEIKSKQLDSIEQKMGFAFSELRSFSHNLKSNFLDTNNLEVLIKQLIEGYVKRNEFKVDFFLFPPNALLSLSYNQKNSIYRIVQELLSNISKHAKAKNVVINFTKHDDVLNVMIEDDGLGFSESKTFGIGLLNIKERVSTLNGTIEIDATNGTTIIINIPTNEQ